MNMRSSAGPRRLMREWREKSDWSKDISECILSFTYINWKRIKKLRIDGDVPH